MAVISSFCFFVFLAACSSTDFVLDWCRRVSKHACHLHSVFLCVSSILHFDRFSYVDAGEFRSRHVIFILCFSVFLASCGPTGNTTLKQVDYRACRLSSRCWEAGTLVWRPLRLSNSNAKAPTMSSRWGSSGCHICKLVSCLACLSSHFQTYI